jgi:ligand-binding sensor domain-containing protein
VSEHALVTKDEAMTEGGNPMMGIGWDWKAGRMSARWAVPALVFLLFMAGNAAVFARTWFPLPPVDSEHRQALATLIVDDEYWVGYAKSGLIIYDDWGQVKKRITTKEGLPGETVTALLRHGDDVWIGTSDGLARRGLKHEGLKVYKVGYGLPDGGITCLAARGSQIFAGTLKGLVKIEGEGMQVLTEDHGLPAAHITALCGADPGLFVGTPKGWAVIDSGVVKRTYTAENSALPTEWITAIAFIRRKVFLASSVSSSSDEWVYLGTAGGGLMVFNSGTYHVLTGNSDAPTATWITCLIHEPLQNHLWVGHHEGISVLRFDEGRWDHFNMANSGLRNNFVGALSLRVIETVLKDYEPMNAPGMPQLRGGRACPCDFCVRVMPNPDPPICPHCWGLASAPANASAPAATPDPDDAEGPEDQNSGDAEAAPAPEEAAASPPEGPSSPPCQAENGASAVASGTAAARPAGPRIIHIYRTWAAVGHREGCDIYFHKTQPHIGQGNFYAYLANKGWEAVGVGVGEYVYAGVRPPGAAEGFLFGFVPSQVSFESIWSAVSNARYTTTINTLTSGPEGNPLVGAYTVGRGGIAVLDVRTDSWSYYGAGEGLADLNVTAFAKSPVGLLVGTGGIGMSGRVYLFKDNVIYTLPRTGLKVEGTESMFPSPVTALAATENRLFVGTKKDGLFIFDGETWKRYETLKTPKLMSDHITALAVYNDVLYIGTPKGLTVLAQERWYHFHITTLGACSDHVQALLWDDTEGAEELLVLWIGHSGGLLRVSSFAGVMAHGGKYRTMGTGGFVWPTRTPPEGIVGWYWPGSPHDPKDVCPFDGLPGLEIYGMAIDDLNLWVGTSNGVGRIRR